MKTLLWYQPEKTGAPDIVCQDGKIIYGYPREEAFSYLKSASDKCLNHDLPWCGNVSLSSDKHKKVFFLKGKFKSVDEHGRTLTFMFLSAKCDDYFETLNNVLQVVHQELSEDTSKCLAKKKSNPIKAFVVAALIALLVIILILML